MFFSKENIIRILPLQESLLWLENWQLNSSTVKNNHRISYFTTVLYSRQAVNFNYTKQNWLSKPNEWIWWKRKRHSSAEERAGWLTTYVILRNMISGFSAAPAIKRFRGLEPPQGHRGDGRQSCDTVRSSPHLTSVRRTGCRHRSADASLWRHVEDLSWTHRTLLFTTCLLFYFIVVVFAWPRDVDPREVVGN